ncbi:methylated-DNA--[protein]-cysteine S-methyltransferase [Extensimonas vulgaris]|uniref:Methylated-DNA--protein-cysteine methyltransferase n=1 Tax=Extensimonas vulgaris TaxID=1031594 RepID=A0A369AIE3_9BURK|nr:methylated-DNA--[protein]-cysteine S-methyltransferase [Extensimonas vulgaris]RCX08931.1 methylated-DNA-[protein]-cysteine S-methyltransferase [Extensimonas vulgaris]TWI34259.1 methylated-DNA-[protein]-cysteine S-methyltransferase [Extensimonas vulgaris]TXD14342.1 methylated-DNA--[protein]-cysteine S-methyltransferase [Extensimonas vulgaris]
MPLATHTYPSPLGDLLAVFTARGLGLLEFAGQPRVERELAQVQAARGDAALESTALHAWTAQLGLELSEYFAGRRRRFELPLDLVGTPFQQRVWQALRAIPYGQTWSYAQQAKHIGQPSATRAVAAANGQNKISIVVPCHRVIGSKGQLTGYGGGLPRKAWLLRLEQGTEQGLEPGQQAAPPASPLGVGGA